MNVVLKFMSSNLVLISKYESTPPYLTLTEDSLPGLDPFFSATITMLSSCLVTLLKTEVLIAVTRGKRCFLPSLEV